MDFLLDPNIAYLFLAGGLIFSVLAILNPGTGLIEIIALFGLLFAGWAIYYLPINSWALVVLFVGVVLFVASVRKTRYTLLLILSILALIAGSVFLFRSETRWEPVVNPWLASIVSILSAGFFWVVARKVLEAESTIPVHSLKNLIGETGEARSDIHQEGSVHVSGELWAARSETPIQHGTRVRVLGREGFILLVESIDNDQKL
ncbi:MAG TPA: NfeD family protein [Anaerolineales bacterium]|nr:NfeD family protein [Anaerolineales bacterium]